VTSSADVAAWMMSELDKAGYLSREEAAHQVAELFGGNFVVESGDGDLALSETVLIAFRRLTRGEVVWSRRDRQWRRRQADDDPGRLQAK
jgi:hypothetical protein